MATKITQQRMESIEQLSKHKCNLEIINKAHIGEISGVLVIITVPFIIED